MTITLGSLCSGYGGLDLAVEHYYGATTVWHGEVDKDCSQVLAHRWPGVPNLGDLTVVDWDEVEPVDILCAGFPCQPFSKAGRRLGEEDERAIFHYIADAIRILRPRVAVLENVSAITSLGGPGVIAALAGLGYDCRWTVVRASDAGAPHRRARWFCIATDSSRPRLRGDRGELCGEIGGVEALLSMPTAQAAKHGSTPDIHANSFGSNLWDLPHLLPTPCSRDWKDTGDNTDYEAVAEKARLAGVAALLPTPVAWDHKSHGPNMDWQKRADKHVESTAAVLMLMRQAGQQDWGKYEAAIVRWAALTRLPPAPTDDRGLLPGFVEWMMGLPAGWVCDLGLSRTAELKMLGNGVVPAQALLALAILDDD